MSLLLNLSSMVEPIGLLITGVFLASLGTIFWWMLHLPAPVPREVARAYRTVGGRVLLVPVVGQVYSDRAVELACRLAREEETEIHLLYVLEIPRSLPLTSPLPAAEKKAKEILDRAEAIVSLHNLRVCRHIERAREASEGILRAALDYGADVIVVGMRPRIPAMESLLGRTTDALLRRAPCEVIVDKMPYTREAL